MSFGNLVPENLRDLVNRVLDKARELLQGEPLRAIAYGAAVIIYLAAKVLGSIPDVSFTDAVVQAGAAALVVASVVETIRRYVYSPVTVAEIVASPPTAAGPIAAAEAAGVDVATLDAAAENASPN